ncbi:hypothetical protein BDD12DRAFT_455659 [Trichophaea hybrida]|nr:hypothetical protein BDD12DRAFT_455659 [Trichophaea hybrida]
MAWTGDVYMQRLDTVGKEGGLSAVCIARGDGFVLELASCRSLYGPKVTRAKSLFHHWLCGHHSHLHCIAQHINVYTPISINQSMAESSNKRRRNDCHTTNPNKKNKNAYQSPVVIEPGWQGMFATCERGREGRVIGEFCPILEDCASKLYPELKTDDKDVEEDEEEDIESAIMKELSDAKDKKKSSGPIAAVKLDIECVTFFRLKPPLVPTDMVRALCESAQQPGAGSIRSKFVHRLTPITKTGKATLEGLKELAKSVLEPHFHRGQIGIKFAIRPTSRNHNTLNRNEIINTIAACVGPAHKVDLKEYDLLILVELYKNICGMSVVKDFESGGRQCPKIERAAGESSETSE